MTPRIVIIDDDPEFLEQTTLFLETEGFKVFHCSRPLAAFRLIRRTDPDAVILDYEMPEITGLEILEKLRASSFTQHIPVLFLTAHNDKNLLVRGFEQGLADFIGKPFHSAELLWRLKAIIRRHRQRDQRFTETLFQEKSLKKSPLLNGKIFILQISGFETLQNSEAAHLIQMYKHLQNSLTHRLCDHLSKNYRLPVQKISILHRRDGLVVVTLNQNNRGNVTHINKNSDKHVIERSLIAANRLIKHKSGISHFLAPVASKKLKRQSLPGLRIFEIETRTRFNIPLEDLLQMVFLDLENKTSNKIFKRILL